MSNNDPVISQSIINEIDHIQAGIFDLNGVMRGKRLPATNYHKILDNGIQLPLSAQNIDIDGDDIKNSRFVFETGDMDGTAINQGAPFVVLNHLPKPILLMPLSFAINNNELFEGCPRAFLKSALRRAKDKQLKFKVGVEIEFCLFSNGCSAPIFSNAHLLSLLALDSLIIFYKIFTELQTNLMLRLSPYYQRLGLVRLRSY